MFSKLKQMKLSSPWANGLRNVTIMAIMALSTIMLSPLAWWQLTINLVIFVYAAKHAYMHFKIEDGYLPNDVIIKETKDYYQKEYTLIHSFDQIILTYAQANDFCKYVWEKEGHTNPPIIAEVKGDTALAGRLVTLIPPHMCTRSVILHELTHLLAGKLGHREKFIRTYVNLLDKYLKTDPSGEMLYHMLRLDSLIYQVVDGRSFVRHDENTFAELGPNGEKIGFIFCNPT